MLQASEETLDEFLGVDGKKCNLRDGIGATLTPGFNACQRG